MIYKLKKNLGKFLVGSKFEGKPSQELQVVQKEADGVNHFRTIKLSNKQYFDEVETCPTCGREK